MKKTISIILIATMLIATLSSCGRIEIYNKYSDNFLDVFDTVTQVVGYTKTEKEFKSYMDYIHKRMLDLHKLYDKYNTYEGINNIKTINDNAGKNPVKVDKEIIDLILFSKDMYYKYGQKTNIALGSVLNIWHDYRENAKIDPDNAKVPPIDELREANKYTDIDKVIVDIQNSTVYLEDSHMSLDVGSVAKGFATEIVAREVEEKGLKSAIISAGGNIRTIGKPLDGQRERWGVGLQNPDANPLIPETNVLDTVFINDASVVSSGDYQRYYKVGDKVYHHIIEPSTLMPGDYYRAVTVITPDSGEADFLSTTVFLLPYEESKKLVESIDGLEALWVFKDGTIEATEGMQRIMKSHGATGAKSE